MSDTGDLPLAFADEEPPGVQGRAQPWVLLVADDEAEVHRVTRLALGDAIFLGRPLEILSAYTAREAIAIMRQRDDVAMVFMDVVMESEHAGLEAVNVIRNELGNRLVRIILRTGQPGRAPERDIVRDYDINDYKEKTELTATRLYTVVLTGLRLYRELEATERMRRGLETVVDASAALLSASSLGAFRRGVLQQIGGLLYATPDALIAEVDSAEAARIDPAAPGAPLASLRIAVGTGRYAALEGRRAREVLDDDTLALLARALDGQTCAPGRQELVAHFRTRLGTRDVVLLRGDAPFGEADARLVDLFCRNAAVALDSLAVRQDMLDAQRQLILLLGSTIEERSVSLKNHVLRVSRYARLLGTKLGLVEADLEILAVAAAMHDLGKIGIPDALLNKPGAFTPEERAVMETHVERGERLMAGQGGPLMQTTGAVIGGHHERWDGGGYPRGKVGAENHLYARIVGVADVYDALCSRRSYKEPWPDADVIAYFQAQRGAQFDPRLVDLLLENIGEFQAIRETLPQE